MTDSGATSSFAVPCKTPTFYCEQLSLYQEGKLHPVHLGDRLGPRGRYKVVHKLGHGGFGTVWLCRDTLTNRWRAVKVLQDESRGLGHELWVSALCDVDAARRHGVVLPVDSFRVRGPNGTHTCLVLPVLSAPVCVLWSRHAAHDVARIKDVLHQAAVGLSYLHARGVCHGDFRPDNLLLQVSDRIHAMSEEDMLAFLGRPRLEPLVALHADAPGPHMPRYVVEAVEFHPLTPLVTDQIAIVDFGLAFHAADPRPTGIPQEYAAPELVARLASGGDGDGLPPLGPAVDVWALACTILEVRTGIWSAFGCLESPPPRACAQGLLPSLQDLLGPLPECYRTSALQMVAGSDDVFSALLDGRASADHDEFRLDPATRDLLAKLAATPPWEPLGLDVATLGEAREARARATGYADVLEALVRRRTLVAEYEPRVVLQRFPALERPCVTLAMTTGVEEAAAGLEGGDEAERLSDEEATQLVDLLRMCWRYFPADRPSAEAVAAHPWFRGRNNEDVDVRY